MPFDPRRVGKVTAVQRARVVVMASGAGSTAAALIEACAAPTFGAAVVGLLTDRTCGALEVAAAAGVPAQTVALGADRTTFDARVLAAVQALEPTLVVLAGWMKLLPAAFVERFETLNTHPSLLPAFPGARAVDDALAYGVAVSGATLHWVDAGLDTGAPLAQVAVPVLPGDDAEALRARIQAAEKVQLVDVVGRLARHGWSRQGRRTVIERVPA